MTESFAIETALILLTIALVFFILGRISGRASLEYRLIQDWKDDCSSEIRGFHFYLLAASRYNELRIAEMRCQRRDAQRSAIHEG